MSGRGGGFNLFLIAVMIILSIASVFRGALVGPESSIHALEVQGFTDITLLDHDWMFIGLRGGEASDAARFTFEATNPIGKRVTVYVFDGWPFKGATMRAL